MRWEYQSPETNLYIVDGKWSWFYVPADHTVTKVAAKQSSDFRTPFALLAGEAKLSKLCSGLERERLATPTHAGGVVLRCNFRDVDRPSSQTGQAARAHEPYALFEVDAATGELFRVVAYDPGGVQVEFEFSGWQFNPRLDKSLFQFQPQKGIAIVDGNLPDAGKPALSGTRP